MPRKTPRGWISKENRKRYGVKLRSGLSGLEINGSLKRIESGYWWFRKTITVVIIMDL